MLPLTLVEFSRALGGVFGVERTGDRTSLGKSTEVSVCSYCGSTSTLKLTPACARAEAIS
jgi:hypothetical protein